jgi:hypothetical protein
MSTFSHSVHRVQVDDLLLLPMGADVIAEAPAEERVAPLDDGLGAIRGLASAMVCNVALALLIAAAWEVWRLLR